MLNYRKLLRSLLAFAVLCVLPASICFAQATRTWVSGVGDDANPCSRTAPCKTFAGAISKTAAGGIIDVLDPGGFGAVTITKALTIESPENWGGILSAGTNGIIVNAGVNDAVILRGLSIDGAGTGINGVRFLAGSKLVMENSYIGGVTGSGIDFEPAAASKLVVINTTITNAAASAVLIQAGAAGSASASLEKVKLTNSGFGLRVVKGNAAIKDSLVSGMLGTGGIKADGVAKITIDGTQVSDCVGGGVAAQGAMASVFLSNSTITNNATGLAVFFGGTITSFGNNRIIGNTSDGNPTSTIAQR